MDSTALPYITWPCLSAGFVELCVNEHQLQGTNYAQVYPESTFWTPHSLDFFFSGVSVSRYPPQSVLPNSSVSVKLACQLPFGRGINGGCHHSMHNLDGLENDCCDHSSSKQHIPLMRIGYCSAPASFQLNDTPFWGQPMCTTYWLSIRCWNPS